MDSINLDDIEQRNHERKIIATVCRYGLAAVVAVTASLAWSCDSASDWRARALTCERTDRGAFR